MSRLFDRAGCFNVGLAVDDRALVDVSRDTSDEAVSRLGCDSDTSPDRASVGNSALIAAVAGIHYCGDTSCINARTIRHVHHDVAENKPLDNSIRSENAEKSDVILALFKRLCGVGSTDGHAPDSMILSVEAAVECVVAVTDRHPFSIGNVDVCGQLDILSRIVDILGQRACKAAQLLRGLYLIR